MIREEEVTMVTYISSELKRLDRDSGGQTLVFVALIASFLFMFVAVTINVGDLMSDKVIMQTAADAAALSGAAWQARGLNLIIAMNNINIMLGSHLFVETLQWTLLSIGCACCGFFGVCCIDPQACALLATETIDLGFEIDTVTNLSGVMQTNSLALGRFWIPGAIVAQELLQLLGVGVGGVQWIAKQNGAEFAIPLGGQWLVWPQLYVKPITADVPLLTNIFRWKVPTVGLDVRSGRYPDNQYVFVAAYGDFAHGSLIYRNFFRKRGAWYQGHLVFAQARPYTPFPYELDFNLHGNDWSEWQPSMDWDTALTPISVHNGILGLIPLLGPIAGVIIDLVIVH